MPIYPFQDGGTIGLIPGDNVILKATAQQRLSLDQCVVRNTTTVPTYEVTFYKSPTDNAADGKEIDKFKLASGETYIPQIVGIALARGQRLIAVTAALAGAVTVTTTYSLADGTS